MTGCKRISVSLPDFLLQEMDQEIQRAHVGRSEFIRESLEYYILECRRRTVHEQLAAGYQAMGSLNLALAEECSDEAVLCAYEKVLSEGE